MLENNSDIILTAKIGSNESLKTILFNFPTKITVGAMVSGKDIFET